MMSDRENLFQPVSSVIREDVAVLHRDLTVREALEAIREKGVGERIVYFYVVEDDGKLIGVVPTRRLLTSGLDQALTDIMIPRVISLPHTATVFDALEAFVLHRFLAFPVVDDQRRVLGVIDVEILTRGMFEAKEPENVDEVFAAIGYRLSEVQYASPFQAFRYRIFWLTATIASGTMAAVLASFYELTLTKSIVLGFFLTLVLGLGESVSIQSMTVTIQMLRNLRITLKWYLRALRRELALTFLLGLACGATVGLISFVWNREGLTAPSIGGSIVLLICAAGFWGLSIPALLHRLKLDLRVASGPLTLAITDLSTLFIYFGLATILL
jgi:magnesium transporter